MPLKLRQVLCYLAIIEFAFAKIYERCELAKELKYIYQFSESELSTWLCIAQHESLLNTSAMNPGSGDHGLFQISQIYWCSPPGHGCNTACVNFRDDNIADDVKCVRKIFKEHQRLFGNGFQAWAVYPLYCNRDTTKYIQGCFENEIDNSINIIDEEKPLPIPEDEEGDGYEFPPLPTKPKIYDPCELAKELRYVHKLPEDQISKWVCIVEHESNYNTAARNPGSGDHGLFQISEQYWCSRNSVGYGCNANCAAFRDNNIADDVKCVRRIYDEHTAISGDGFNAWAVYPFYCKGDTSRYIERCKKMEQTTEKEDENEYEFPSLPTTPKTVVDNRININDDREYEFPALPIFSKTTAKNTVVINSFQPITTEKVLFTKPNQIYTSVNSVQDSTTKSLLRVGSTFDIFTHYYTSPPKPTDIFHSDKVGNIRGKNIEDINQKPVLFSTTNVQKKSTLPVLTQPVTSVVSFQSSFTTTSIPTSSREPSTKEYEKYYSTEAPVGNSFSYRIGKAFQGTVDQILNNKFQMESTSSFNRDISITSPTYKELVTTSNRPNLLPKLSSDSSSREHSGQNAQPELIDSTPKAFTVSEIPLNRYDTKQLEYPSTKNRVNFNISDTTKKSKQVDSFGLKKTFPGPSPFGRRPPPPRPPPKPSRPTRAPLRPNPPPLPPQGLPRPIVTFTPLYTEIPPSTSVYATTPKYKQSVNKFPRFSARGEFANLYNPNSSSKSTNVITTLKPVSTSFSIAKLNFNTSKGIFSSEKNHSQIFPTPKLSTDLKYDFSNNVPKLLEQTGVIKTSTITPPSKVIQNKIRVEEFPGYTFVRTAFGFKLFQKQS